MPLQISPFAILRLSGANLAGASCALVAAMAFAANDALIKFESGHFALHQIVLFRSMFGILVAVLLFSPFYGLGTMFRTRHLGQHLLRGVCVVFANLSFFLGLAALPIAESVAIFFIAPLLITFLSVMMLGERVGPWRWAAVFIGLVGVLLIIRPGSTAFQLAALLPLAAALFYALLHMFTRRMRATESAATMTVYVHFTFVTACAAIGLLVGDGRFEPHEGASLQFLLRAWVVPDMGDFAFFAVVGLASTLGGFFISQAYRMGEAGFVAPFEYLAMPLAIVSGAVIFGEWPDGWSWLGMLLILVAGLVQIWRETRTRQRCRGQDRDTASHTHDHG